MKYSISLLILCFFIFFSGCASHKNYVGGKLISGPAATDIVNYVNQGLISIAELEKKSLERYASVAGKNFTSNQKLLETLKDFVIPTYKRFVTGLGNISPETQEVRNVHAIYLKAAEATLEGFQTIMVGLENDDERIIQQGNKKLEEGQAGVKKWRAALNELYIKNGVAEMKDK